MKINLKTVGRICTVAGILTGLASNYVSEKKQEDLIEQKVKEAISNLDIEEDDEYDDEEESE